MESKQDRVYYAHSKQIYNTNREKKELAFLRKHFDVLCPNTDIGEHNNIEPYLEAVKTCNRVVCSEYKKHIGKGIFEEIRCAFEESKRIFVLRKRKKRYHLLEILGKAHKYGVVYDDEADWKINYAKLSI